MIKFVISPEYFGSNDSKNDIKAQLKNLGAYNVEIDENTGFVSALMTQDNYDEFVINLGERVEETAEKILKKYSGIKYINFSPDYTIFNIGISKLKPTEIKDVVFELLMSSATHQVISGIPQVDASIKVNFYNKDKELIKSIDTAKKGR